MISLKALAVCSGSLALRSAEVTAIPSAPSSRTKCALSRFMPPAAKIESDVSDLALLTVSNDTMGH